MKNYQEVAEQVAAELNEKKWNGIYLSVECSTVKDDPDYIEERGLESAKLHERDYARLIISWDAPCEPDMESRYECWSFDRHSFEKDLLAHLREKFGDDALINDRIPYSRELEIIRKLKTA